MTCKECVHYDFCTEITNAYGGKQNPKKCRWAKPKSRFVELPCEVGGEMFVSPDRGKHFHKAKVYGCDEKGVYIVLVNDNLLTEEEKHIVANPMKKVFYDWFLKLYSREEAENALKERCKE